LGGDGREIKKVGSIPSNSDSSSVLLVVSKEWVWIEKLSIPPNILLSWSWYSASLPRVFGVEIGTVKTCGLMRVVSQFHKVISHCWVFHL
jgi:hypothetical protein